MFAWPSIELPLALQNTPLQKTAYDGTVQFFTKVRIERMVLTYTHSQFLTVRLGFGP